MFFFDAWVYKCLLGLEVRLEVEFFLKNLDFTKILLLGLREIGRGIFEILAYLLLADLDELLFKVFF